MNMAKLLERPMDDINRQRLCKAYQVESESDLPPEVVRNYWALKTAASRNHMSEGCDAFFFAVVSASPNPAETEVTFKTLVREGKVLPSEKIRVRGQHNKWGDAIFECITGDEVVCQVDGKEKRVPIKNARPIELVPA